MAGLNGMNILGAFAAQLLIYGCIGASRETDVYFASAAIPQLAATVMATTASGALVPFLARKGRDDQSRLAWTLLLASVVVVALPAIALFCLAQQWVPWLFPGFSGQHRALCVELVRIQIAATPFIAASAILTALHHSRSQFAHVEAANLVLTLGVGLALYLALPAVGVPAAAWIFSIRFVTQALVLCSGLDSPRLHRSVAELREVWHGMRVLLAGNTYFKTDIVVDRYLLSMSAAGSLSLMSLAQTIFGAVAGMIGQAWGSTAVPRLAVSYNARDKAQFVRCYHTNFWKIGVVSTTLYALIVLAAQPVITALTHQKLSTQEGGGLWLLLLLLGGIPVFGSIGSLVSGCFYAIGDTRTPTFISVVTFTLFIVLKVFVFGTFGLYMFCLLTSGYYIANTLIMMVLLNKKLERSFSP